MKIRIKECEHPGCTLKVGVFTADGPAWCALHGAERFVPGFKKQEGDDAAAQ